MKTILIIDDDIYINEMLNEVLEKENYSVMRAYSGTEALLLLEKRKPDLILLDLMLPGFCGEEILQKVKEIPTIVISAKQDMENKVDLLLNGAADYVTKPFNVRELLARIALQLRKSNFNTSSSEIIDCSGFSIDKVNRCIIANDKKVHMTPTEFAILKLLAENAGQVITKSKILDLISLDTPDCTESSLKIHIGNIRKKLRQIGADDCLESVWGIGFKLNV